jgi:hypothetical protein
LQEAACGDCLKNFHKPPDHKCENVTETEGMLKDELSVLLTESKKKLVVCEEAHQTLESSLNDLQMQRDNAKGLIQETFQSYKAMLEKKKVGLWWVFLEFSSPVTLPYASTPGNAG